VLVFVAAACGDDSEVDPVAAAELRLTAAQEDLTEAQTAYDDARTQFCDDSKTYIQAIDRYGGVFDESAATVGEVKTAGRDLAAPREDVAASADEVSQARDEVAQAEQDLADAQAALAAAQVGTSAPPDAAGASTTTEPLLPEATTDRIEQAEADFAAVSEGISDATPLVAAGAAFNAAAFALEVAWLRVFADAGCLSDEQRDEAVNAIVEYTTALQNALKTAGYYDGEVDGVYGNETAEAVEQLQRASGLPVTGFVDRATAAALEAAVLEVGGDIAAQAIAHTSAVQSTLKLAGYWTGPVDGVWTPELTDALMAFQTALGVPPTGAVDAATLSALEQAIATARTSTTTPSTTTPSTETTIGDTTTTSP
jgi:murein L,D-transpeptidase YcbB/YkuD